MKKIITALLVILNHMAFGGGDNQPIPAAEHVNIPLINQILAQEEARKALNSSDELRAIYNQTNTFSTVLKGIPREIAAKTPSALVDGAMYGFSHHYVAPKVAATLTQLDQTFMPTIAEPILNWLKPKPKPLTPEEQKKHNARIHAFLAAQKSAAAAQASHEELKVQHKQYKDKITALNEVLEYKRRLIARATEPEAKKKLEAEIKAYEAAEANMVLHLEIALDNDIETHQRAMHLNQLAASAE